MTTPWIVRYDQTGPAAGTRAAVRSSTTAKTSQTAPNIQTQPTFFRAFDPHFGHVTLVFTCLVHSCSRANHGLQPHTAGRHFGPFRSLLGVPKRPGDYPVDADPEPHQVPPACGPPEPDPHEGPNPDR